MFNKYGIPPDALDRIISRDKACVYCHKVMDDHRGNRADWWTIEHLNYLPPWNNPETVTICCWSCNASRSDMKLRDWFKTKYCVDKNINLNTVAEDVLRYVIDVENKLT